MSQNLKKSRFTNKYPGGMLCVPRARVMTALQGASSFKNLQGDPEPSIREPARDSLREVGSIFRIS